MIGVYLNSTGYIVQSMLHFGNLANRAPRHVKADDLTDESDRMTSHAQRTVDLPRCTSSLVRLSSMI